MAKNTGHDRTVDELRAEIASSRGRVSRDLRGLQYEVDVPAKIRRSFREQTGSWIAAAAAVGTLVVLLPIRKKKVYIDARSGRKSQKKLLETGFALGALKIVAGLVRPIVVEFVKNRLIGIAGQSPRSRR
jgi:hypothetical protein